MITCEQPDALILAPETSPVKAPSFAQCRVCAPISMRVPRVAVTAVARSRNDGQITISQCSDSSTNGRNVSKKDVVPARSLCIFQFPPIRGVRTIEMPATRLDFKHSLPHTRGGFVTSQLPLHRFEFTATGVAELPQRVFAVHRTNLYLLGSEIRLRISDHNGF